MALMRRTHTCGELRATDVGKTVILNGWVNSYRAGYAKQVFVDLRDRYGLTQVVFESENAEMFARAGFRTERPDRGPDRVRTLTPGGRCARSSAAGGAPLDGAWTWQATATPNCKRSPAG